MVAAFLALAFPVGPAQWEALQADTQRRMEVHPQGAWAKQAHIDTTVAFGTTVMNDLTAKPMDKYPKALALYRVALSLDPDQPEAKANSEMIIGIYESLGRPVPTGS